MPENRLADSPPASMSSLVGGIIDDAQRLIRQQIDQTRSSLTEKLETLEQEVRGTVQSAKATVEETIENVRSTVHGTVESVKRTFDVNYQVDRHPWVMMGGSVLAGYAVGCLLTSRSARRLGRSLFEATPSS